MFFFFLFILQTVESADYWDDEWDDDSDGGYSGPLQSVPECPTSKLPPPPTKADDTTSVSG